MKYRASENMTSCTSTGNAHKKQRLDSSARNEAEVKTPGWSLEMLNKAGDLDELDFDSDFEGLNKKEVQAKPEAIKKSSRLSQKQKSKLTE